MRNYKLLCSLGLVLSAIICSTRSHAENSAMVKDKAAIQADLDTIADAIRTKNLNGIMSVYWSSPDLFVYDMVPPRAYIGMAAWRKNWAYFVDNFKGPWTYEISDVAIETDHHLAYSRSTQHFTGASETGKKVDITERVTDVFRKIDGKWLIIHEHISVPYDPKTGMAIFDVKP